MKTYYFAEIGKKYNKLTVLEKTGSYISSKGRSCGAKFLCKCDCGNEDFYRGSSLIRGISKHCKHCAAKSRTTTIIKKGDVFGKLTILSEEAEIRKLPDGTKRKYYSCQCDCGDINSYYSSSLNIGRSKECMHCAYKKRPQSTERHTNLERSFNLSVVSRCKKSDRINNFLTIEEYESIIKQDCYYCGEPPRKIGHLGKNRIALREDFYANGVDRVDSSEDYTLDNVVPCCSQCNTMKMSYTKEEFFNKIKIIYDKWIKQDGIIKENLDMNSSQKEL